ncbi:unnamed protein product [Lathyrus oleraceus]
MLVDDMMVVSEVIGQTKKIRKPCLIFKLDFDKSYDSVSWEFLEYKDDMVVVNEVIGLTKKIKLCLIFKLDFDKYYNSMSWEFLEYMLLDLNLMIIGGLGLELVFLLETSRCWSVVVQLKRSTFKGV